MRIDETVFAPVFYPLSPAEWDLTERASLTERSPHYPHKVRFPRTMFLPLNFLLDDTVSTITDGLFA